MSLEFELPLVALIFIVILLIVYFVKPKVKLFENKMYEIILILSSIEIVFDTYIHFLAAIVGFDVLSTKYLTLLVFLNKFLSVIFVMIVEALLSYILIISYNKIRENYKLILYPSIFVTLALAIYIFSLDVEIIKVGNVSNSTGSAINFTFSIVALFLIISTIVTLINFKKHDKRYYAIFGIIIVFGIFYLVQIFFPGIIFYGLALSTLCYIMYFTIENPDLRMIETLNIAKTEAEKANLAKSDFLASMSHEIRTPLNAINGFSNAIMDAKDLPEAIEYAKDIVKSSDTLLEIIGGVLDVSKIESNKMDIVESLYYPREEFANLAKITQSRIGEKPIIFNYKIAEDVPYQLYGDRGNIKKIVTNLLTNAVKYTSSGQILFNVKCINKNDVSHLIISVQDSGMGIKEEYISKLFTKFERLEVERNTTAEGTGLGLAITKRLVELMNGSINVKSQFGVGSIFVAQIPQKIAVMTKPLTDTQILSTIEIMKKKEDQENIISGQKVLIVDDNTLNIKVAQVALKKFNLELSSVKSGQECIDKIKYGEKYDLILMDIMMPGLSGDETLLELKKIEGFSVPVIALTADAIAGSKEKYLNLGFTSYISKPFSPDEIKEELIKVFKKK